MPVSERFESNVRGVHGLCFYEYQPRRRSGNETIARDLYIISSTHMRRGRATVMQNFLLILFFNVTIFCRLHSNKTTAATLTRLLDTWLWLRDNDQSVLIEAVEQLSVNPELSAATLRALQDATDKLKSQLDHSKIHSMILVQNKFLSLFSR